MPQNKTFFGACLVCIWTSCIKSKYLISLYLNEILNCLGQTFGMVVFYIHQNRFAPVVAFKSFLSKVSKKDLSGFHPSMGC